MKKVISILVVLVMAMVCMTACGGSQEEDSVIHEGTKEDVLQKTGVSLEAPNGADKINYYYIDNDPEIAQAEFFFDGVGYVQRAEMTDVTDIMANTDGTVSDESNIGEALESGKNVAADFCGMFEKWDKSGTTTVCDRPAVYGLHEGGQGYIAWLDVAPGVMYSMSMDNKCSLDALKEMAEDCFIPMQE